MVIIDGWGTPLNQINHPMSNIGSELNTYYYYMYLRDMYLNNQYPEYSLWGHVDTNTQSSQYIYTPYYQSPNQRVISPNNNISHPSN